MTAADCEDVLDTLCSGLKAWSDLQVVEHQRRLAKVHDAYNAMVKRVEHEAANGLDHDGVLAWCRERIEIPAEVLLAAGKTTIAAVKRHHANQFDRDVAMQDAMLRAALEEQLTAPQGSLH